MAATVEVNVKVNDALALSQLGTLDSKIDELNKKSININVQGDGLGDASEDAKDLGNNTKEANSQLGKMFGWAKRAGAALAVAFGVKSVKDALNAMKDVDSELANIRKVTGESAEAIESLGRRAYVTASKYGISAKEFLSSAAEFAKAGYSNYEQLAELAIKTQLVGDVTDAVASKFLLSADAAFKFNGNIKSLSTVLDRANIIENNYATSIQKIAQGFPIVASTASMANMSIDELTAALGTITAVTQETGTKAATALRALIMNITKQVGESLEDELGTFNVTEDSVNSMTQALIKYGDAAISAAAAAGEVIDPMEAIRSLATAYKNGEFTRDELFSMLMDVGGKLRTNQLAALIENFDMFEEMLGLVERSSGSADREVEVMLDTWESKINQLSNTWTSLVSNIVDTSAIKGAIEEITGFLGLIDKALTKIKEEAYEGAEREQAEAEKNYEDLFGVRGEYREELDALRANYSSLNEFDRKRLEYLTKQEEAMSGQVSAAQQLTREAKVDYLNEKVWGDMVWDEELGSYQQEFVSRAVKQLKDFQREYSDAIVEDGSKNKRETAEALNGVLEEYSAFYGMIHELQAEGMDVGEDAEAFAKAYEGALTRAKKAAREASEEAERFGDLTLKDRFEAFGKGGETATVEVEADTEQAEEDIKGLDGTEVTANAGADTTQAEQDIDALNGRSVTIYGNLVIGGAGGLGIDSTNVNLGFASAEGTKNAPGGPTLVNELGPELISDNGRAYIANGGKPAIVNLGRGAIVLTAEETKKAIGHVSLNNGVDAFATGTAFKSTTQAVTSITISSPALGGKQNTHKVIAFPTGYTKSTSKNSNDNLKSSFKITNNSGGYGGGGSGDSSSKSDSSEKPVDPWKEREDKLKDELDALDELSEWYHNQKKHEDEADTYQKAIEKIDALRQKYLKAGFDETSKEVTTLANKIFDYEKEIAEAKAHAIDDLEEELDNIESQIELAENQGDLQRMLELQNEAQKKVADLIEAYRAAGFSDTSPEILKLANMGYDYASDSGSTVKDLWQNLIDALEDMQDTQDDANALAEKQLAVDEARESLQNAQNQRTVRVFNPVTGQWEWVADSKSIQQAQESLKSAEEALLKEQQSQELEALKRAMENGGSLSGVTIGPGLSALLSGASVEQTNAFASALGVLSGGLATTADTSMKSIFDSVDSHDTVTQYQFNGVTIDAETAKETTLAELTEMITPLALTTNMPA